MLIPPAIAVPPLDSKLGAHAIFVSVPRAQVIFVKLLLETFEGVAAYRTQEPEHVPGRALIALLVPPDFVEDVRSILAEIREAADVIVHEASSLEIAKLYEVLFDIDVDD